MPKKKTIFAVHGTTLYVKAKYAGMNFLCLLIDGISLTFFQDTKKDRKTPYLTIDQAIAWHEKEVAENRLWPRKCLDALLVAKQKFVEGKLVEQ